MVMVDAWMDGHADGWPHQRSRRRPKLIMRPITSAAFSAAFAFASAAFAFASRTSPRHRELPAYSFEPGSYRFSYRTLRAPQAWHGAGALTNPYVLSPTRTIRARSSNANRIPAHAHDSLARTRRFHYDLIASRAFNPLEAADMDPLGIEAVLQRRDERRARRDATTHPMTARSSSSTRPSRCTSLSRTAPSTASRTASALSSAGAPTTASLRKIDPRASASTTTETSIGASTSPRTASSSRTGGQVCLPAARVAPRDGLGTHWTLKRSDGRGKGRATTSD